MPETITRLARLRAGTREAHARIEAVPALAQLLLADLTVADYISVLRHMHGFHAAFEPLLAGALAELPQAAAMLDGARAHALAEDLAWFEADPIAAPANLPAPADMAAALGALYVIEGSALGGRVIARHVAASLGVAPGRGGDFYGGTSATAGRERWQRLCELLETAPLPAAGPLEDRLVGGAIDTFRCLERWMRRIKIAAAVHRRSAAAVAAVAL